MDVGHLGERRGPCQQLQWANPDELGTAGEDAVRVVCGKSATNTDLATRSTNCDCYSKGHSDHGSPNAYDGAIAIGDAYQYQCSRDSDANTTHSDADADAKPRPDECIVTCPGGQ